MEPSRRLSPEETEQRKARIVALRRDRVPFDVIAAELGISAPRVHRIFWDAVREFPHQQVAELREEQRDLADRAVMRLMAIAEDETVTPRTRVEAWTAIRGWAEHVARLLGLNAPTRREITVLSESTVDAALRQVEEEHAAKVRELEAMEHRAIEGGDGPDLITGA